MARYEHLPIYKQAMGLGLEMEKIVRNIGHYDIYRIDTELKKRSLTILYFVVRAISIEQKKGSRRNSDQYRKTQIFFLGMEIRVLLSIQNYKKLVEQVEAVARQSKGQLELFNTQEKKRNEQN